MKNFNKVYYSQYHSSKLKGLPYWISSYGYWLKKENDNKLPRRYRVFKPGTVVMADFGINVGSEMSMAHFAIVLSKNDSSRDRNVIVVPLSSKYHPKQGYLNLGPQLFNETINLIVKKMNGIPEQLDYVKEKLSHFGKEIHVNVPSEDVDFLSENGFNLQEWKHSVESNKKYKDENAKNLLNSIKEIKGYENHKCLKNIVDTLEKYFQCMEKDLKPLKIKLDNLTKLKQKSEKYNKKTFVDVQNITSLSKLKIKKFNDYNISENIVFDSDIINKIKNKLNEFI